MIAVLYSMESTKSEIKSKFRIHFLHFLGAPFYIETYIQCFKTMNNDSKIIEINLK